MGGLLRGRKMSVPAEREPSRPRPVRLPTETDPSGLAASQRTRQAAAQRRGRLSTILSDGVHANPEKATTGSSGVKLGA